jgi:hypothetical protein
MSYSTNSINSQNKDTSSDFNNNLLLCPNCKLIPKILINELTDEITYICSSPLNKKKKVYSLNYFNNNIDTINKNDITLNTKCSLHNKKYISYCNSCEINLCSDCKNINKIENKINHLEHDILDLKNISPTGSNINKKRRILESFKKNLNKANLIFEEYISQIKFLWKKVYTKHNNLIEYKQKIIDTYINIENNYNSINNLNEILKEIKFINKPFDFLNEVILNNSVKNTIKKIENIFEIKNYGQSNVDEMNIEEILEENRNNTLNSSSSTQKPFAIIKSLINVKLEENNNFSRTIKEYLICGLSSGILKIYDTNPKFNFKKNIYLNYSKDKFIDNKEINYMIEIYQEQKNKFYLLICTSDLEIIEISNNFENYSFIQKIGEPNSIYDKALFICSNNNKYILANSSWISFLNLYKLNSNNSYELLHKMNNSEENFVCFIESIKGDDYFEILCANYIEGDEDTFYIIFYKIYENNKIENKRIKISSFINDQDSLVKINEYMAGLILGNYFNLDYENVNNTDNKINENSNGILLIDLVNKQIITIIQSPFYISKIFPISGGLFIYNSRIKKIRLIKYENMKDKYPQIVFDKNKFYFNSENLEFCCEDIYIKNNLEKNLNNSNENYVEDEPIFLVELTGGAIVLAKNQKIKLFK